MSGPATDTLDQGWSTGALAVGGGEPAPGVLLVFTAGAPALVPIPLAGGVLSLGRGRIGADAQVELQDACMSRRHAEVSFDGAAFTVRDLGSRNGTALDGARIAGEARSAAGLLRTGDSLFLLCADLRPFQRAATEVRAGVVLGPTLRKAWDEVVAAGRAASVLHLTGESGTGKELAARAFHAAAPAAAGPFVPVNCAAVPPPLAERLFFGARRGAYSGADHDADGYVQAAEGGTLFLDEVAELDAAVQAKLLRFLETREAVPVGAAKPRHFEVRIVSATHRTLRDEVGAGRFREDLYFRLGRPEVWLPPLRERREDVPWLIQRELSALAQPLPAHASLAEACLLRSWPGNVRELGIELRTAGAAALASGAPSVQAQHLREGPRAAHPQRAAAQAPPSQTTPPAATPPARERRRGELPPRAQIEQALARERGNVSRAAHALGLHRTQLRRFLERESIDPHSFAE